MHNIKDNPPPLPDELWHEAGCDLGQLVRQIEAEAFARGVDAEQAAMQDELESLQESYGQLLAENVQLRAKLKALEGQNPVAIFEGTTLYWIAGQKRDRESDGFLYTAAGAKHGKNV